MGPGAKHNSDRSNAETLRRIVAYLTTWKDAGPDESQHTPEQQQAARKAMVLLQDNEDVLHHCKESYGFKSAEGESSYNSLRGILEYIRTNREPPESIAERTGYYDYQYFAQQEFISQLKRWADQLTAGNDQQGEPGPKGKAGKKLRKVGRPRVDKDEGERRRKLKADWERYKETGPEARKELFCKDECITVEELQNALHWCRCHSK